MQCSCGNSTAQLVYRDAVISSSVWGVGLEGIDCGWWYPRRSPSSLITKMLKGQAVLVVVAFVPIAPRPQVPSGGQSARGDPIPGECFLKRIAQGKDNTA